MEAVTKKQVEFGISVRAIESLHHEVASSVKVIEKLHLELASVRVNVYQRSHSHRCRKTPGHGEPGVRRFVVRMIDLVSEEGSVNDCLEQQVVDSVEVMGTVSMVACHRGEGEVMVTLIGHHTVGSRRGSCALQRLSQLPTSCSIPLVFASSRPL